MTLDQTTAAEVGRITSDLTGLVARLVAENEEATTSLDMSEASVAELAEDLTDTRNAFEEARAGLAETGASLRDMKRVHQILEEEHEALRTRLERTQAARDEFTVGIPTSMRTVRGYTQTIDQGEVFAVRWGDRIYYADTKRLTTTLAPYGSVPHNSFVVGDLAPFEIIPRPRGNYGFGFRAL